MTTLTTPKPTTQTNNTHNDSNTELDHYYCDCDENHALCGTNITGMQLVENFTNPCTVCEYMNEEPCPKCGY